MIKFIETFRQRRKLNELKHQYHIECNTLASFKAALPRAIKKNDDRLSGALRIAITDSQAECDKLRNKITILKAFLDKTKANNTVLTTGG